MVNLSFKICNEKNYFDGFLFIFFIRLLSFLVQITELFYLTLLALKETFRKNVVFIFHLILYWINLKYLSWLKRNQSLYLSVYHNIVCMNVQKFENRISHFLTIQCINRYDWFSSAVFWYKFENLTFISYLGVKVSWS